MKTKLLLLCILTGSVYLAQAQMKIGIIGLDTSHSIAFTNFLNGQEKKDEYKDFKIVAAYPYGSKTIQSSYDRIPVYVQQVEEFGVEIVSSIDELLQKVDFVMLETNDGNLHLEQAYQVFKSGKPLFIDKPLGATLAQSIAIFQLAKEYDVPVFSSSSLRYMPRTQKIRNGEFGKVIGADCYSPASREKTHPDFGWYGIHGVETLFTIMGKGCVSVNRMSAEGTDVVVGLWGDGRIGTFRGIREGKSSYGGMVFTDKGIEPVGPYEGYEYLLREILIFFRTGTSPVSEDETLEIFTFMQASNESKRKNGQIILMEDTYRKGLREANKMLKDLK